MQLYIILAVFIVMIIAMISNKFPLGLITVTGCVVLAFAGATTVTGAFSGFSNKNLIVCAGFLVIGSAFGKTSLINKLQEKLMKLQQGKSGIILYISLLLFAILLSNMITTSAVVLLMVVFLSALPTNEKSAPSQLLLPIGAITVLAVSRLPFGMTAVTTGWINGFLSAAKVKLHVTLWDVIKVGIIPMILCFIYSLAAYKILPKHAISSTENEQTNKKTVKLSKRSEIIIYIVFVISILAMFFSNSLGDFTYIIPAAGAIILIFSKAMDAKEVRFILSMDMIFMLAGIFSIADIMSKSGASKVIGKCVLHLLGNHPNGLVLILVFGFVATILSNFISHVGCMMILTPISIATALAAGFNPIGVAIATLSCCCCGIILPTGSPAAAVMFGFGNYKIKDTFKYTIPLTIIFTVSMCLSASLFFPL